MRGNSPSKTERKTSQNSLKFNSLRPQFSFEVESVGDDKDLIFELPPAPEEYHEDEEQLVVTNLVPGKAFFYLPKTTEFDLTGFNKLENQIPGGYLHT